MLSQIFLRLDEALSVGLCALHLLTINLNVPPLLPVVQHLCERIVAYAYALSQGVRLVTREDFRQEVEQVLWSFGMHPFFRFLLRGNGIAEELHLAPQVILQGPSHEVLQRLVPLLAIRHIEHHRLQKGYHVATEGKVLVHTTL